MRELWIDLDLTKSVTNSNNKGTSMKKYRILQAGDMFYPQWRYIFGWFSFYKELVGYDLYNIVVFKSKVHAQDYLDCSAIKAIDYTPNH